MGWRWRKLRRSTYAYCCNACDDPLHAGAATIMDSTAHPLPVQPSSFCAAPAATSTVTSSAAAQMAAASAQQETQGREVFRPASGLADPGSCHPARRGRPGETCHRRCALVCVPQDAVLFMLASLSLSSLQRSHSIRTP